MDSLQSCLANCSFVKHLGNTISSLNEQYPSDLNDFLDKHGVSHLHQRSCQMAVRFLSADKGVSLNAYGARISHHKIELDCASSLPFVIH